MRHSVMASWSEPVKEKDKIYSDTTVKLGIKELFGHRKIVHSYQFGHYLLSKLANWSWKMVHYCQFVPYLTVP